MDTGFFSSKYFIISAVVASVLIGGAAGAYYVSEVRGDGPRLFSDGCDPPTLGGSSVAGPDPVVSVESDGRRRIETFTLPASSYEGGALLACIDVGDIVVEPTSGSSVEVVFEIAGKSSGAVAATEVDAAFATKAGGLVIGAWEAQRGESGGLFRTESAGVLLTVRLPETGAYDLDVFADVGDIQVGDLILGDVAAHTDVGHINVHDVDLQGNATIGTDVGNALLVARSVQSSTIEASSDVGDVTVEVPLRPEIGYDAFASSDVGEASIQIGSTEANIEEEHGPSSEASARSSGFADKVTKVVVRAVVDVGDARITGT